MLKPKTAGPSVQDVLVGVLCAAIAAWAAMSLDSFLMSNYGTARFWETWVDAGSALYSWVPLIAFSLISGIAVGVVIGLLFPQHVSLKVAALAAVTQLAAAIAMGGIASGVVIAAGLLSGALPSRVTR